MNTYLHPGNDVDMGVDYGVFDYTCHAKDISEDGNGTHEDDATMVSKFLLNYLKILL